MQSIQSKRRFSAEEKEQLLANLDIEVSHRTRQLESWLADTLAGFRIRHERQIAYIPHLVRSVTMAEFGDRYNGDIQACLRAMQREKLGVDTVPIDRTAMKRKWVASQDGDTEGRGEGSSKTGAHEGNPARATKAARMAPVSPQKKPPFSSGPGPSRPRLNSTNTASTTKGLRRAPSPSPHKPTRQPTVPQPRQPSRPTSPSKIATASSSNNPARPRPPSSATFNPALPKTPAYPPRWPRKHESMLSINGSPLANPYELGLDWLAGTDSPSGTATEDERDQATALKPISRSNSIVIRRDPSFASSTTSSMHSGPHSRSNSQSQTHTNSHATHSRSNSQAGRPMSQLGSSSSGHFSARVAVPTKDGHMLEFDPLLTSPMALDKLEGITESAKKQAKEDMSKLLQAAVSKWSLEG
ncbi:hypothetical protein OF83DRAFT_1175143 [Amylostereum chailletii]|nr:hypothetical protein OF83DRAFT_1175143 [Amylostereum chailletii]